jgi:hypothetical protein
MAVVGFEGTVRSNTFGDVPDGYAGLNWTGFTALGKKYLQEFFHPDSGFRTVLREKADAYVFGSDVGQRITAAGVDATFTLKQAVVACGWNTGESVTFTAKLDGVEVGSKTFVLDRTDTSVNFGVKFRHIDEIVITTEGGTDADPADGGAGPQLILDNLKIELDEAAMPDMTPVQSLYGAGWTRLNDPHVDLAWQLRPLQSLDDVFGL